MPRPSQLSPPRQRDSERSRIYTAEQEALGGSSLTTSLPFSALMALADAVYATPWWHVVCPDATPRLVLAHASAKRSQAHYATKTVRIAPTGHCSATLCHELAHFVAPGGHHAAFRAAQVELLRLLTDDLTASCLSGTYRMHELRVDTISPAPALGLAEVPATPWSHLTE